MEDCIFCKIVKGEIPGIKIFENDFVIVIMDIMPLSDGHVLVIPKEHHETIFDMNEILAAEIMKATWKVANVLKKILEPEGLNILQNNYPAANQLVPHFHVHLIPRRDGDNLNIGKWTAGQAPQEDLNNIAEQLKQLL